MSGSGSSGHWPPDIDEIPCTKLKFSTQISSPQAPAILSVQEGEVLSVEIRTLEGVQTVAVVREQSIVGGLMGGKVSRLRDCLLEGHKFKATVLSANGPQVRVEVEHGSV